MLPLKRAFVDISSADQSDSSMIFAPELRHRDPTTSFVTSKTDHLLPSICLGMIQDVVIKLLTTSATLSEIASATSRSFDSSNYHFLLERKDGAAYLAYSPGNCVASLNISITEVINLILLEVPSVDFDFYVTRQSWSKVFRSTTTAEKNPTLCARVNVSASASVLAGLSKILSERKLFLQRPASLLLPGEIYRNPHHVQFPGIEPQIMEEESNPKIRLDVDSTAETTPQKELDKDDLKNEFAVVFGSLIRSHCLSQLAADKRIKATLKPYQKEGLDFISQREFGPVEPRFSLWKELPELYEGKTCYSHIISETKTYDKPVETGGGILADEMGLGKTLTMLATIVATLKEAAAFQISAASRIRPNVDDEETLRRSRATLVLVPSHMLIKSWTEEIHKHVYGGLRVCEYHGRGRETNVDAIADAEVVLSTYHTLAGESAKLTSPLFKIHWFRIILDEAHIIRTGPRNLTLTLAHIIRTSSTLFFESVRRLEAKFRWCVTGTPVQNGLQDLGSLVEFLQVPMLDTRLEFKQHIIDPLVRRNGSGASNLRLLLDSICLRRLNKLLDLPNVNDIYEEIDFSDSERVQYDTAHAEMSNEIKRQVNLEKSKRGYFGILELEMRLRRMCNHGTFEQPRPEAEVLQTFNGSDAMGSTICNSCKKDLSDTILVDSLCNGHYTTCGHLICSKCLPQFEQALATAKEAKDRICPLCGQELPGDYLVLSRAEAMLGKLGRQLQECTLSFQPDGVSSKINALLANVENTNKNDKSIIFSGWTRTLDLIEQHLQTRKIHFRRIDGASSLPARNKTLEEFRKDNKIRILMMTTGTGAVGLNLAVANTVHIFEPQWNPMVESQAVARVVRLGQKKPVSIIRYIIRGTVEQTMRSQQQRKIALADLGWSKNTSTR